MRIAVLGLGHMGQNHRRVLRELGHEVVTVDPAGHADYPSIPKRGFADGAVLATPPEQLLPSVLACESFDVPVLLVEKPLAPTLAQAATMAVRLPGVWVGYVERFNPVLAVLEDLLDPEDVRHVEVKRIGMEQRNELGPYKDLATHDIDLLEALRIPLEKAEIEVGYGKSVKQRTWEILREDDKLVVDWQFQTISVYRGEFKSPAKLTMIRNDLEVQHTEPLAEQWRSLLAGDTPPVDTRLAVQVLRSAVHLENEHEPVAA